MVKRELEKNPKLAHEDWSKFLPKFKKSVKNTKHKKRPIVVKKDKDYSPFPNAPEKSKLDIEMETGQYFLSEEQKQQQKLQEIREQREKSVKENLKKRLQVYQAPKDDVSKFTGTEKKYLISARALAKKVKDNADNAASKKRKLEDDEVVESLLPKTKKRKTTYY